MLKMESSLAGVTNAITRTDITGDNEVILKVAASHRAQITDHPSQRFDVHSRHHPFD